MTARCEFAAFQFLASKQLQIRENGERGCVYIAATRDSTYLLYYEQDVQYTPDMEEKYFQMQAEVGDIQFIVSETARDAISISQGIEEKFGGTIEGIVKGNLIDSITVDLVEYVEEDDTESPKEFHEYVKDYVDGWLLLFFRVEDGVIQYVLERPIM